METIVVRAEHTDKKEVEQPQEAVVNTKDASDEDEVCSPNGNNEENTDDNVSDTEDEAKSEYQPEDPEGLDDDDDDLGMADLPVNASLHAADEMKRRLEEIDPCEKLRALCKKGEVQELEDFLARKEDTNVDIDYVSSDGWTCLHEIITHGCQFTAVARVLLQHEAKVNTTDFNRDTPLHASLLYHNTENTKLLLEHGANLDLANSMGRKPIHNANDAESLELLLDHGAAMDSKDAVGNTPLHYAVLAKDVERVKLLISRKCDINASNNSGSTALHLASCDPEIASIILGSVSDEKLPVTVNSVDNVGNSPLHVAVKGRHRDTVRVLVATNFVRIDAVNFSNKTPLSFAKDKDMKNILLKKEENAGNISPTSFTMLKKAKTTVSSSSLTEGPIVLPGNETLQSPSILKRKRHQECLNGTDIVRKGPRLRFSDIVDYSGVEEVVPMAKRVRAAPLYTEPQFSSDEDN